MREIIIAGIGTEKNVADFLTLEEDENQLWSSDTISYHSSQAVLIIFVIAKFLGFEV